MAHGPENGYPEPTLPTVPSEVSLSTLDTDETGAAGNGLSRSCGCSVIAFALGAQRTWSDLLPARPGRERPELAFRVLCFPLFVELIVRERQNGSECKFLRGLPLSTAIVQRRNI
jgi:hypothetical protein